jgi:MFS family permease
VNRRAPFTALLTAYVVSLAGTQISAIAIPWLVLTTTGSAAKTGLVGFATMAPYVAAQVLSGPLVDRVGLRRAFVLGNLAAGVLVGLIPLTYALGGFSLPVLVALVVAAGTVRGIADCANSPLVPATAEAGGFALERAAGLTSGANRTAILVGAPLAGVLVTVAGPPLAVAVDAATFVVAAGIAAVWVRVAPGPASRPPQRGYMRDLAAGLRFIRGDRLLLGIIAMVAVTNLLDQGLSEVMLPVWVRDEIGTASVLGVIGGVAGAGAVVGNLLGAWIGPRVSRRALYTTGYVLGGAPRFLVLALSGLLPPVVAVHLVSEVFGGSLNAVVGATAYERIPEELRARVLGTVRASAWVGVPFGALFAGYAVEALGLRGALLAFGVTYLLVSLAPVVFPSWRQMRRPEPAPPATLRTGGGEPRPHTA